MNHLLYMDDLKLYGKTKAELEALVNTVRIFTNDIKMKFGLQKWPEMCHTSDETWKEGGGCRNRNAGWTTDERSRRWDYKYLGILEANKMKMGEMKVRVRKEYYRRIRKLLTSKLNGGNMIKAMNTWAVATAQYTAGIVDWN